MTGMITEYYFAPRIARPRRCRASVAQVRALPRGGRPMCSLMSDGGAGPDSCGRFFLSRGIGVVVFHVIFCGIMMSVASSICVYLH